jgi:hypothetical protein
MDKEQFREHLDTQRSILSVLHEIRNELVNARLAREREQGTYTIPLNKIPVKSGSPGRSGTRDIKEIYPDDYRHKLQENAE